MGDFVAGVKDEQEISDQGLEQLARAQECRVLDGAGARIGIVVCIAYKKPAQLGYVLLPGVQDVWNHPNVIFLLSGCFASPLPSGWGPVMFVGLLTHLNIDNIVICVSYTNLLL